MSLLPSSARRGAPTRGASSLGARWRLAVSIASAAALLSPGVAAAAPAAPTLLKAPATSSTAVGLTWTNSTTTSVTDYKISRNGVVIGSVASPTHSFVDQTRTAGSSVDYTVAAVDPTGTSVASNQITVATPTTASLTVITACSGIALAPGHYILANSLTPASSAACLTINSGTNVSIECNNNTINLSSTASKAIALSGVSGALVSRCKLSAPTQVTTGVASVSTTTDAFFTANQLTNVGAFSITGTSTRATFANNVVTSSSLAVTNSAEASLQNNTFTNGSASLSTAANATVTNNNRFDGTALAVNFSPSVVVAGNRINNTALNLVGSTNATVSTNLFPKGTVNVTSGSNQAVVKGNVFNDSFDNNRAVYVLDSPSALVQGNDATQGVIVAVNSGATTVDGNTVNLTISRDFVAPIQIGTFKTTPSYVNTGDDYVVTNNTVDGGGPQTDDGILIYGPTLRLNVSNNKISNVYDAAIETVQLIKDAWIAYNTIDHAGNAGIGAFWTTGWEGNQVVRNHVDSSPTLYDVHVASQLDGDLDKIGYPTGRTAFTIIGNYFWENTMTNATSATSSGGIISVAGFISAYPNTIASGNVVYGNGFGWFATGPIVEGRTPKQQDSSLLNVSASNHNGCLNTSPFGPPVVGCLDQANYIPPPGA